MAYYVLGDMKAAYREACVFTEDEMEQAERNYSGWYRIATFETEMETQEYCNAFNNYDGEPDVELGCCGRHCTLNAYDYEHWNGMCTYMGQFEDSWEEPENESVDESESEPEPQIGHNLRKPRRPRRPRKSGN